MMCIRDLFHPDAGTIDVPNTGAYQWRVPGDLLRGMAVPGTAVVHIVISGVDEPHLHHAMSVRIAP